MKEREALKLLRDACNYRDAAVSSGAEDKLDYALSLYCHAIEKANLALESPPSEGESRG